MNNGFTKLFASIVTSSIWVQDDAVLRVWIAMLALCDSDGMVHGAIPGLASLCRVSMEDLERALGLFTSPDRHSRTQDHEGRRVEVVPGGWKILNYESYRERGQDKDGSRAPYMRKRREAQKGNALQGECNALHRVQSTEVQKKEPPIGGSKEKSPAERVTAPEGPKCPAAEQAPPTGPATAARVAVVLPCVGKGANRWPVTEAMLAEWAAAYPGLDARLEAERMRLWLEANPSRRKTFRGMGSFALAWLARSQNTPRSGLHPPGRAAPRTSRTQDADAAFQRQLDDLPLCGAP